MPDNTVPTTTPATPEKKKWSLNGADVVNTIVVVGFIIVSAILLFKMVPENPYVMTLVTAFVAQFSGVVSHYQRVYSNNQIVGAALAVPGQTPSSQNTNGQTPSS